MTSSWNWCLCIYLHFVVYFVKANFQCEVWFVVWYRFSCIRSKTSSLQFRIAKVYSTTIFTERPSEFLKNPSKNPTFNKAIKIHKTVLCLFFNSKISKNTKNQKIHKNKRRDADLKDTQINKKSNFGENVAVLLTLASILWPFEVKNRFLDFHKSLGVT